MNANEIIKALECCKKDDCDNCPNDFGNCYSNLAGYALEVIQQTASRNEKQKAEIERLSEESKKVSAYIGNGWGYVSFLEFVKKQRAEVIKEFVERFLKKIHAYEYLVTDRSNSKDYGMFTVELAVEAWNKRSENK